MFEVTVNDRLIYSKKKLKRLPAKGEVLRLMQVENFPKGKKESAGEAKKAKD